MIGINPQTAFAVASNIVGGENPPFTCDDFRALMPAFSDDIIADEQLQHFVDMAHAAVSEARWLALWKEGMRLYIAHFVTLYLQSPQYGAPLSEIQSAGQTKGNATSKTVDGVSVSYDNGSQAASDLTGWAAFKLTTYGMQFATLARLVGKGGMYVP